MKKWKHTECLAALRPIQDALEVVSGKWKLPIIISISAGNHHFRAIQRSIPHLSSKVLSKELKDLEAHQIVERKVADYSSVVTEYNLLPHAKTLSGVMRALRDWEHLHRQEIFTQ